MSVQNQIDRINQNVANTYAVLSALGADIPAEQNSDNLAVAAGSAKAVLYSEQSLTEAQQAQARENIGVDEFEEFAEVTPDTPQSELANMYASGVRIVSITDNENLVSSAIGPNGEIFNGCGYMTGYRLNSSGGISSADSAALTGFMPYTFGQTIQISGGLADPDAGGQYVATYDSSFNLIGVNYLSSLISNSGGAMTCADNNERTYTINTNNFSAQSNTNMFKTAAYIRVSLAPCVGRKLRVHYI